MAFKREMYKIADLNKVHCIAASETLVESCFLLVRCPWRLKPRRHAAAAGLAATHQAAS